MVRVARSLFVLAALWAGALPAGLVAQEPSVRAYLEPAGEVGVGRPFVLAVEVTGTQEVARDPVLPDVSAFAQYLGSNTQSSVSMVNGRTTVSLTLQYRYQALQEGSWEIPAFEVQAGGRTFATDPLPVTVSASPSAAATDPTTGLDEDALFITAEPSGTRVREGEPLIVEYRIWTRVDVTSFGVTRVPEPEGFWVEDLTPGGQPDVEQRERDGVQYATALIRRVALVPTGPGERTIEPVGIEAQVRVRRGRDPFDNLFGRSSIFGTSIVPTAVLSNPLTVEVSPLPEARPEPFSGVVGDLRIEASLDRDSVDTNEAVTLTVRASGSGSFRTLPVPELGLPSDFEVFPPEVSEQTGAGAGGLTGTKTFEWVLIPRAPGEREVPPVELAYFDAGAGEYRVASSGALPLTVSGTAVDGPASLTRGGVTLLREDIRFIRLGELELRRTSRRPLVYGPGFWLFALLPMAAVAGAVALRRHRELLEGDVAYARGRRASRLARRRLSEARRLANEDDARPFYAETARALRGLVADRLNLAEAGLNIADVDAALAGSGVDDKLRAEVRACLEESDRQRFAPSGSDAGQKSGFLDRVGSVMDALDRAIR